MYVAVAVRMWHVFQEIVLKDLPPICMPPSCAADKLAELRVKAIKARVAKPVPYIELAEFVPGWAKNVRRGHEICTSSVCLMVGACRSMRRLMKRPLPRSGFRR